MQSYQYHTFPLLQWNRCFESIFLTFSSATFLSFLLIPQYFLSGKGPIHSILNAFRFAPTSERINGNHISELLQQPYQKFQKWNKPTQRQPKHNKKPPVACKGDNFYIVIQTIILNIFLAFGHKANIRANQITKNILPLQPLFSLPPAKFHLSLIRVKSADQQDSIPRMSITFHIHSNRHRQFYSLGDAAYFCACHHLLIMKLCISGSYQYLI